MRLFSLLDNMRGGGEAVGDINRWLLKGKKYKVRIRYMVLVRKKTKKKIRQSIVLSKKNSQSEKVGHQNKNVIL